MITFTIVATIKKTPSLRKDVCLSRGVWSIDARTWRRARKAPIGINAKPEDENNRQDHEQDDTGIRILGMPSQLLREHQKPCEPRNGHQYRPGHA